jgi:adenylosuccinate synthase
MGTYPYVTSSNTGIGGILTGLDLGWQSIDEVIGVV